MKNVGKKDERIARMLGIIEKRKSISTADLAVMLDVSEMTIRRDLQVPLERRLVKNVRGNIIYNSENNPDDDYTLSIAETKYSKEKQAIGAYAAKLIQPDDLIIIDNGTTTEQLAAHIPLTFDITVLCYNMNVLNHLYRKPNVSLIFGGGYFHPQTLMFESSESLSLIRRTRATKVFVSAAGIHEKLGVTCVSNYEVECKREIVKSGDECILLVDSSKFGVIKPCFVSDINIYSKIITDSNLPQEWVDIIRGMGVELILV